MAEDLSHDLIEQRRRKAQELRSQGIDPYPVAAEKPSHRAGALHAAYGERSNEQFEAEPVRVSVAGRMMANRIFGKAAFTHLQDRSGRIQLFFDTKTLGAQFDFYKKLDVGDIVFAEGPLFRTKTGELTVRVERFALLTKSVHPLPEKWHGLKDVETRYRRRYIDLIVNEDVQRTFALRSKITTWTRRFFTERDFLEVETPMLHPLVSGAKAKPFTTHHNALGMDLYLRIAPELYLKRLIVGGFERVFEIGRNFRNEGISIQHNPEFTMLEFYWAYATYEDLMTLTEELFKELAHKVTGGDGKIVYQGAEIDFGKPFRRVALSDAVAELEGFSEDVLSDLHKFRSFLRSRRSPLSDEHIELRFNPDEPEKNRVMIFEEIVEARLIQPTFVTGFPAAVSPLARRSDADPELTDRFELFVFGRELANGFNELADPEDQRRRFEKQVADKEAGDEEAMDYDADYILALEHGLPPTAGEGIGIDRLVMLLTDSPSIRDVILFPQLRKEQQDTEPT